MGRGDGEVCEARGQYFEKAPPTGSASESDVSNVWNKSFPSKIFLIFIWKGYTKQRLRK